MNSLSEQHPVKASHIEHLKKCTWHNMIICRVCNTIESTYTKNGHGYKNFKQILSRNNITQKISIRILGDQEIFLKAFSGFANKINQELIFVFSNTNSRVRLGDQDEDIDDLKSIANLILLEFFNNIKKGNFTVYGAISYVDKFLKTKVKEKWLAFKNEEKAKRGPYKKVFYYAGPTFVDVDIYTIEGTLPVQKKLHYEENLDNYVQSGIIVDIAKKYFGKNDFDLFVLFFKKHMSQNQIVRTGLYPTRRIVNPKISAMVDCVKFACKEPTSAMFEDILFFKKGRHHLSIAKIYDKCNFDLPRSQIKHKVNIIVSFLNCYIGDEK